MAYHYADLVHTQSFTPKEPQVELLEASWKRNILCVIGGPGKSFICCKLIEHVVNHLSDNKYVIYIANSIPGAVRLAGTLRRLTSCNVVEAISENNSTKIPADCQVVVTTTNHHILSANIVPMSKISLVLIHGCDAALKNTKFRQLMEVYKASDEPPKLLALAGSILDAVEKPWELEADMGTLESFFHCEVDTSSEIVTALKCGVRPSEFLLEYDVSSNSSQYGGIDEQVRATVQDLRTFLQDHRFAPWEIYESFIEDLLSLPLPQIQPLHLLDEFEKALDSLGPWAADKAAYVLLRQIEALKIRTPYERHFLLLNLLGTTLVKIRAMFDDFFRTVPEKDRLLKYCSPKLIRFFEVVQQFQTFATNCDDSADELSSQDACRCCAISLFLLRRHEEPTLTLDDVERKEKRKAKAKNGKRKTAENTVRPQDLDPHSLCGLILVNDDLYVQVIFQLFHDLKNFNDVDFIRACYTIQPLDELEDAQGLEKSYRKQEVVLKNFRMRECNLLIGTSFLESGLDLPKCNLVVRFDYPASFRSYELGKCRARGQESLHCILVGSDEKEAKIREIARYHVIEKMLVRRSSGSEKGRGDDVEAERYTPLIKPFCPLLAPQSPLVFLSTAITLVNKYCAKLPSDTFTRLTPCCINRVVDAQDRQLFICVIRLPINSPLKEEIVGPAMPTRVLARRFAALQCCLKLHAARELDDNLLPISKESFWLREEEELGSSLDLPEDIPLKNSGEIRPGTTKRRQYYNKRIATCLTDCRPTPSVECYLYSISMVLTCPLPEEQNTRGRPIRNPEDSPRGFGILTGKPIPSVGAFPIFTRAGEVEVALELAPHRVVLEEEDIKKIIPFINYTFTSVLRLQKYLMMFDPDASENSYFIVPTIKGNVRPVDVDWGFLDQIFKETLRGGAALPAPVFQFDPMKYADAVVSPWYRNQDQPQYFYVAEICHHLSPKAAFPGSDYSTFEDYYLSKYDIQIQDAEQALLDVDHTSARLNFLTPRYVNRKGVALPTTSEEKKKAKRENLAQKQILVPELCNVHPFPASLWQKAVCLPCILHRLNALLLADEVRRMVASDLNLGDPGDPSIDWGPLDFGWKLADVLAKSKDDTTNREPEKLLPAPDVKSAASVTSDVKDDWLQVGTWDQNTCTVPNVGQEMKAPSVISVSSGVSVGTESDFEPKWDSEMWPDRVNIIEHVNHTSDTSFDSETCSDDDLSIETGSNDGLKIQFMDKDVAEAVEPDYTVDTHYGEESEEKWECSSNPESNSMYSQCLQKYKETLAQEEELIKEKHILPKGVPFNVPWSCSQASKSSSTDNLKYSLTQSNKAPELADNFDELSKELEHADLIKRSLAKYETQLNVKNVWNRGRRDEKAQYNIEIRNETGRSVNYDGDNGHVIGDDDDLNVFSLRRQPKLEGHPGPSPSLILQALTMSNANDGINLERLETIGDSFLKYAITSYLYCTYENVHEGKLSHLRSKQVSNLNLYRLGRLRDFAESMVATKFEPHDNWLPPCYFVPRDLERALIEVGVPAGNWNRADLPSLYGLGREEITLLVRKLGEQLGLFGGEKSLEQSEADNSTGFIPYNLMTQHSIPDKSIADCVEALIGAYLVACGPRGALLFMSWLGIKVLPKEESFAATGEDLLINRAVGHTAPKATGESGNKAFMQIRYGRLSKPSSPLLRNVPDPEGELARLMTGFEKLEAILEYSFHDRSYLLQALTHASYSTNRLTDCYQRLEFLGDAVLDYLITRHLYDDPRHHSPGALTDLRSALVNNTIFASLAVRFDFHKYFRHLCPGLHEVLDRFVRIQEENGHVIHNECYLVEEGECEIVEDVEVPKALGDIFESVAGAIFLDSGMRLDAVWKVYYCLMKTEIDAFSTNVPKSPIRELLELEPETAQFGKPEKLTDGRRVRVAVEVFGKGTFKGIGRNYRIAKCTAAKCALKQLKRRGLLERRK